MRSAAGEAPEVGETGEARRPLAAALVAAVAVFAALAPFHGLEPRAHAALVVLVVTAGLWLTEAIPLAVTALLVPVLAVLFGAVDAKTAFAGFGDPILFLFLGTFLLTDAIFTHGLHARLSRAVLGSDFVRRDPRRLLPAVGSLGCGISAWVNNTATTAIILPLALAAEGTIAPRLLTGVLLLASYSSSLGGLATPVGTAPNLIGLRLLEAATGERVSFAHWCAVFAPLAIVATLLTAAYLAWRGGWAIARVPAPSARAPSVAAARGTRWSRAEKTLLVVLAAVVAFWITPGILQATPLHGAGWVKAWSARLPEPAVPLLGAVLLFFLPSGRPGQAILKSQAIRRVDWGTLLLFGGGLSLGGILFETGLARAMGEAIFAAMPIRGEYGIILAATTMAILVSEVTTNTASASLVVPIVIALAQAAGVDPLQPALAATIGCSFGFMLPVSTPPNALVFATGKVRIPEMIRYGVALDLLGAFLVSAWVWWFL
jgi:sodium-dependent dicarboxylate transporter 2/3/5